jgi:hypothetical protein
MNRYSNTINIIEKYQIFEKVILNFGRKHPEIKGYILIQEYPGCRKRIGDFEPYTSGEFSKYPHIWKPVYHKEIEREIKLNKILNDE